MEKVQIREMIKKDLTDILIRMSLVGFLVFMSMKVFSPFMGLMLWALILAVTLFPLHQQLANKLGGKQGRAATIFVLSGIMFLGVPTVMLSSSMVDFIQQTHINYQSDSISIKEPPPSVAKWPVVGKKVYEVWAQAAKNLPDLLKKIRPQLEAFAKGALEFATGMAGGLFQFLFSMIIAGIMLAYGKSGSESMLKIINRVAGHKKGKTLHKLSTATIRSVAMGVVGVSTIQALLFGIGFIFIDLPGAAIFALVILVFGIAQLPAIIFTIPTVAFIWWSGDSTLSNVFFTVYFILTGFVDNVLKPIFLGRGVDAPMPVVLLCALGGMISAGLLGLSIGAIFLSLAYVIFMAWVDDDSDDEITEALKNDDNLESLVEEKG
ncbi:MAG: AI-2E family transporter [gamma proteobacterium symbiont of Bathyaustriella thionipta]|nr:AI-2E family transporter [gamma proteobacterium symbiont of Bathyaustriella thionipta]MCU7951181.1 AI-2E family transporter [gamma proteobacterium symbiont of Bathyaustriella thionipta]MCU7954227.1 AI-2E family transporter [gamma proteobacterium symbiont of Bathyaustriella thionipta]MCU7957704.1 AI-2E family transporter [gamma proteobacterium symbiont of Bathyaustriella thionipta]MCU7968679.1 AI-2E family transporter [gamma proteobacterium symbiont of Bathyaustriella thionipta]